MHNALLDMPGFQKIQCMKNKLGDKNVNGIFLIFLELITTLMYIYSKIYSHLNWLVWHSACICAYI